MAAKILVTGDVVLDHNVYAGQRFTPDADATQGMLHRPQPGGALLTLGLLESLEKASGSAEPTAFGLKRALDLPPDLR